MEDIAPKLLEKIQKDFERNYLKNKAVAKLKEKLAKGMADYKDGHAFAIEIGTLLAEAFQDNISSKILPDGKMYYNIADRIIRPMLKEDFKLISEHSAEIQEVLNKKAKIKIKAIKPEMNEDKVQGIIDIVSGKEKFDEIAYMLNEPIINFSQAIVDDTVKVNAEFQSMSGMSPKIIRTSSGKCCEWCEKIAGIYDYEDAKKSDVFKRHRSCVCLVEFVTSKKIQNVHSKKRSKKEEIEKRIQNSFTKNKEINRKTKAQAKALQEKLKKEMSEKKGR
nr:MAG TPA: hypothetical protein [Caudoviricetes sp.]